MHGGDSLGELIRHRMTEKGWTLQAVSDRCGLSVPTIWALREGTRGKRPRRETIDRLAEGLSLPIDRLLAALDESGRDDSQSREAAHLRVYRGLEPEAKRAVEEFARSLTRPLATVSSLPAQAAARGRRR